jgi:hypothetical protein
VRSAGSLRIALTLLATLTVVAIVPSLAEASSPRWAHPDAHGWSMDHSRDIQSLLEDAQLLLYEDTECNPVLNGPCPPTSRQIVQWPTDFLSTGCDPLTAAISTVRADGPIPAAQAQRWWSRALADLANGCAAVVAATAAYNDQGSSSGPHGSTTSPATAATSDLHAASLLSSRVERYLNATVSSNG